MGAYQRPRRYVDKCIRTLLEHTQVHFSISGLGKTSMIDCRVAAAGRGVAVGPVEECE